MILTRRFFDLSFFAPREDIRPEPSAKTTWALIGDINSHRAGIPEHLIEWRRAKGEDDLPGESR